MKRLLVVVVVFCCLVIGVGADTIGENFEGGGVVIGGSGYFYTNLSGYWEFRVAPWMDFLVYDGFAPGLGVSFYTDSDGDLTIGITPDVSYTFGYNPDATSGLAHTVGLSSSMQFSGGSTWVSLYPWYRLYYFVAPRIAPYLYLEAVSLQLSGGVSFNTYIYVGFGMAFLLPNQDRVISNARK